MMAFSQKLTKETKAFAGGCSMLGSCFQIDWFGGNVAGQRMTAQGKGQMVGVTAGETAKYAKYTKGFNHRERKERRERLADAPIRRQINPREYWFYMRIILFILRA